MQRLLLRFIKLWFPVVLWMAAIFAISSIPGESLPDVDIPFLDKAFHLAEFLILGFLIMRALVNSSSHLPYSRLIILSVTIAFLYAIIDELHQSFISERTADILDALTDLTGSVLGGLLFKKKR